MPDKPAAVRPFDQILREINAGAFVAEITDELTDVIAAVRASGKAGKLSVTLSFKPRGECNSQIEVVPTIKGTKPEPARRVSIFFVNDDDGLQRDDPHQRQLAGLTVATDSPTTQERRNNAPHK